MSVTTPTIGSLAAQSEAVDSHVQTRTGRAVVASTRQSPTVEEETEATTIEQETLGTAMSYLAALSQHHSTMRPLTMERISQESSRDPTISSLVSLIQIGCPEDKGVWPKELQVFHQYRADLTTAECMVLYKGPHTHDPAYFTVDIRVLLR